MLLTILSIVSTLVLIGILIINFYPSFGAKPSGERLEKIKTLKTYKDDNFVNLSPVKLEFSFSDYKKMISKMLKGNPNGRPANNVPVQRWSKEEVENIADSTSSAIWYGHSSFYLKMNNKNILLDPMFGEYPAPLPYLTGKRYYNSDSIPIAIEDLPEIDLIVYSHDHYDHLDYPTVLKLKNKAKHFLVPMGLGSHLEGWGVPSEKITELYWDEETNIDGIRFVCTPSQHFSGRGLSDRAKTLWCSWVIEGKNKIYFSGDSGYFDGFKKIGDEHGPFDLCLMECGQYDSLWSDIHMFPEETVQAHIDLKGKTLIPIHWGAFTLANHEWYNSADRVLAASLKHGIDIKTPRIGEEILIGKDQKFDHWWKTVQ